VLIFQIVDQTHGLLSVSCQGWRSWNLFAQRNDDASMRAMMHAIVDNSRNVDGKPTSLAEIGYVSVGMVRPCVHLSAPHHHCIASSCKHLTSLSLTGDYVLMHDYYRRMMGFRCVYAIPPHTRTHAHTHTRTHTHTHTHTRTHTHTHTHTHNCHVRTACAVIGGVDLLHSAVPTVVHLNLGDMICRGATARLHKVCARLFVARSVSTE
jgi:hypothetical protein